MSAPGAFHRVLSRFKLSLTNTEEDDFRFSNLQDVHDVILKIQQDQVARRALVNLNRIKPFLEGMEQYGKVIEVFLNTSNILAFVWGPVKFLLMAASNMTEAFDKLLEAYEMLGESIPQFLKYEQIFRDEPLMEKVLELFYEDVLNFHRRALKVFNRRGWKLMFKSMWKDFESTFQNIIDNLQRHKRLVETQASLADFEAAQKARTEAGRNFDTLWEAEKKRQRIAVTQWLAPADSNVDQEKFMRIRNLYPGTGHWLLKDGRFKTWYDPLSVTGLIFWLYGIPGAGKTILASLVVEEARNSPSTSACFFYCKYGDSNKNTFDSVARGILAQLLHQNEDLLPFIYHRQVESSEVTLRSNDTLEDLLRTALENIDKTYIVIDGLDECEKSERTKILVWFIKTIKSMTPGRVRALFVSRNEGDIGKKLSKAKKKRIDSMDNSSDMKIYLQSWSEKIQRKFELSDDRKNEIASNVFDRAEGMFLFSYLVMDNLLNQTTEAELDHELLSNIFPAGLGQAYARVVERIYNNSVRSEKMQAKKLLGWIVCSKRPLKWHEIQGAVSIDLNDRTMSPKRRLKVTMKELCGSLVEVQNDTVSLVHTTAKFHLINMKLVDVALEDANLAALCVQYLNLSCFDTSLSDSQVREFVLSGHYSFQDYAAVYWIEHVETAGQQTASHKPGDFENLVDHVKQLSGRYWASPKPKVVAPPTIQKRPKAFEGLDIFEQLALVLQSSMGKRPAEKGTQGLGVPIQRARSILEQLPSGSCQESLHNFYGPNLFRCEIARCQYFFEGFLSMKEKEQHEKMHRRPFRCTYAGCHISEFAALLHGSCKCILANFIH